MKKIKVDCYEVVECWDRDISHVSYFEHQCDAIEFAKSSPYYSVRKVYKCYNVNDSLEEYLNNNSKESKKKRALEKLSDEEKKLLGLI